MKQYIILTVILLHSVIASASINFNDYFTEKTLRVDFELAGNNEITNAYLSQLYQEPHWGGRQSHLEESLRLGDYLVVLKDSASNITIYEEGFATLFEEWQDTKEAEHIAKSFPNSVILPFPLKSADLMIIKRDYGEFTDTLLQLSIIPNGKEIAHSTPPSIEVDTIILSNPSHKALDIAILAEGFTADEMYKFKEKSRELMETLYTSEVFHNNKEKINAYAICAVSEDSDVDKPSKGEWKNTYFNATFETLYSERYLMTKDIRKVRDAASLVPYDQIYIIINTEKYGGGGIYNFYSTCSAYGRSNDKVLIHEFGHGLAALADEYFYDDNMLIDYIDLKKEPWQKNITTLVDFDSKWADLVDKKTPIPTSSESTPKDVIGAYEGAAYVSKEVYRAYQDCRMKTNTAEDFCPVCEKSIQEVINFLTE